MQINQKTSPAVNLIFRWIIATPLEIGFRNATDPK